MSVLLECGDVAHATCRSEHFGLPANHPCCVIHAVSEAACTPAAQSPNLEGRQARCSLKCKIVRSSLNLAFFEFRGEGSPAAREHCAKCGYYEVAHNPQEGRPRGAGVCLNFVPHGAYEFDKYYCGCCGWD